MDPDTAHGTPFDLASGQEHPSSHALDIKRQRDLYDDRFQQLAYTISDSHRNRASHRASKADTSDQPFLLCPIEPRTQRLQTADLQSFPRQRFIPDSASTESKVPRRLAAPPLEDAASTDRLRATTPAEAISMQMNYAFSDGAASSDTDVSLLYSQTSDTDPDLGPFTPISPGNFQSHDTALSASGLKAWRPKELRLVGRRRQESSPAESVSRNFFDASQPLAAPSANFVGLGIQLPKSSATALDDLVGGSSRAASPANKARPSKRPLKPLALASGVTSAGELPRSLSPALRSSPWDSRQRSYSNAGISNTAASEHSRLDTAFHHPNSARSRETSVESSLSDWRSAPRSAIPVLPPTPAFSTAGGRSSPAGQSWAREREARAAARAAKSHEAFSTPEMQDASATMPPTSRRGREVNTHFALIDPAEQRSAPGPSEKPHRPKRDPERRTSARISKSLSPAVERREQSSDFVARPFSPTVSFSSQARVSRSSSRRKAPPAPLILLPNGRTASTAGSPMGLSTGSPASSSSKSPRSGTPSPKHAQKPQNHGRSHAHSEAAPSLQPRHNDLAVPSGPTTSRAVPGSALLSPAMSIYHEAFHSPLDGPADQQADSGMSGLQRRQSGAAGAFPGAAAKIPSLSIETVSSPPKTAYFDLDDESGPPASSPSDYGDGASFLPSSAGSDMDSSLPSFDSSRADLDAEGVPLIFRRMLKDGTSPVEVAAGLPSGLVAEATQSVAAQVPLPSSAGVNADADLPDEGSSHTAEIFSEGAAEPSQPREAPSGDLTQAPSLFDSSVSYDRMGIDGHSLLEDSNDAGTDLNLVLQSAAVSLETPKEALHDSDDARTPLAEPIDLERDSLAPTPVPMAHPVDEEYTLTDADAEGSTDRDSDLESLDLDNVSSISHPFAFASPPLRVGPLGELAGSVEHEDAPSEDQKRRSDLSMHSHRTSESTAKSLGMGSSTPKVSESALTIVPEESIAVAEPEGSAAVSSTASSLLVGSMHTDETPSVAKDDATGRAASPEAAKIKVIESRESEIVRCESPESIRRPSEAQSLFGALNLPNQEPRGTVPSSNLSEAESGATRERPVFDTHIFEKTALAEAEGVASPKEIVGPSERPISMRRKSHRPMNPPPLPPSFNMKPASRIVMKALPDRALTSPLPSNEPRNPSVDASSQLQSDVKQLASRPKLRLDTSSPPPPEAVADVPQDEQARNATSQLSSPVNATSPGRRSPQQHFLNPGASHMPRSAPLPQGFFPARSGPSSASQGSSPALDYMEEAEKRPDPRSRWSSDSESEDDNPKRSAKAKRANTKRRTSSLAPSNRTSLTSVSGSTTPILSSSSQLPRKSLLHSLGLRKKSFASLSTASGKDSRATTPALESPGLTRTANANAGDGFPFPDVSSSKTQPGPSQAPGPRSSRTSFASLALGHKKQSPSIASQVSVAAASVPALRQKASSASLRTDTSSRPSLSISDNQPSESARMFMSPPPSPSRDKPTGTRRRSKTVSAVRSSMGMEAVPPMPTGARSRASSGRPSLELPVDAAEHRDRASSMSNTPSADLKVPKGNTKSQRRAAQSALKASAVGNKLNNHAASGATESLTESGGAKEAPPLVREQDDQTAQRAFAIPSGLPAYATKSAKARQESPESVEHTPKIAYRALEQAEASHFERAVPVRPRPTRKLTSQSEVEAYEHIGKGFVDAMSSPESEGVEFFTNVVPPSLGTVSSSTIPAKAGRGTATNSDGEGTSQQPQPRPRISRRTAKARKLRRLAREANVRPHYPSLSDAGHAWVREHPGQALAGDHGPKLLALSSGTGSGRRFMSRASHNSGGGGRSGRGRGNYNEDDESDDDYGSYDRGFGGAGGAGGGGGGGSGGSDDSDSDGDTDAYGSARDGEEDASTSEDSEDDYGEDDTMPDSGAAAGGSDSEDSDDVPLGDRVDDVDVLQRRLRAQERRQQIQQAQNALERGSTRQGSSKASRSRSARADPSSGSRRQQQEAVALGGAASGAQHADELSRRLLRVQMRQEQRSLDPSLSRHASQAARHSPELDLSRAALQREAIQEDVRADRLTRARSMATRVRPRAPTDASGMPPQALAQARLRRGSDAGQRVSPSLNPPPIHTMPPLANQARGVAMSGLSSSSGLPASSNAVVSQAAMAVATQAAREGRIPASAIPLQAQALAIQATSSGVAPGVMAPVNLHSQPSQRHPAHPGNGAGHPQQMPQVSSYAAQDKICRTVGDKVASPDAATRELPDAGPSRSISRRRPAAIDTRLGLSPMQGSSESPTSSKPLQSPPPWGHVGSSDSHGSSSQHAHTRPRQSNGTEDEHQPQALSRHATRRSASGRPERSADPQQSSMMPVRIQQHRVYLVNRQRYASCEVPIHARARDLVLDALDRETMQLTPGRGGWVIFEVCPGLGIERPLREYELVSSVAEARPDPSQDHFLLKQTELAPYLSLRAVPTVSPMLAGYAYVRDRRGKWYKRWLELREHGLYHAKNDKGKEETFICHLSSFDVYLADSAAIKAPKAHSFAARSQDQITMFENKEDFLHYFSLSDPSAHRDWIRAILNARTYVLRQEHAALFQPPVPPPQPQPPRPSPSATLGSPEEAALRREREQQPPLVATTSLSRRGTSKRAVGGADMGSGAPALPAGSGGQPGQKEPLIPHDAFAGPFEKGSLLANEVMRSGRPGRSMSTSNGSAPPLPPINHSHATRPFDVSTHERTRARYEEERRRAEIIERQRRAREEGKTLISVADDFNDPTRSGGGYQRR